MSQIDSKVVISWRISIESGLLFSETPFCVESDFICKCLRNTTLAAGFGFRRSGFRVSSQWVSGESNLGRLVDAGMAAFNWLECGLD